MAESFKLPEIGEGVVEGEIVEWHVKPGDTVTIDQELVAVLTDKATVEIAADFNGVVTETMGQAGDVVAVDAVLLTYSSNGEPAAEPPAPANAGEAAVEAPADEGALLEFPLPEIGEGVVEGEVVEWHVSPGDEVKQDTPVVAVLTDKATVEITAPVDAVVLEVRGEPGEMIGVGDVIMKLKTTGPAPEGSAASIPAAPAPAAQAPAPVSAPAPVAVAPEDNPSISAFGTPLATPAVRKLAGEKGLDLRQVRGTGPNHRITRDDVLNAGKAAPAPAQNRAPVAAQAPPAPAPTVIPPSAGGETREKLKGLRKAIHGAMTRSKQVIPHFTYVDEVEMDRLMEMRAALKQTAADQGVKLNYLPFVVKAVVLALKKFPILNASVDDAAGEIVYKHSYNMGVATATPNGLIVPVLKDADRKTVLQISSEIAELSDRARNMRASMDDLTGGTFTITSLGRLGGLHATPIINHPEVGILGIHNLQERAVVRNGQIVIRNMMNISVSFDHRVVDGDVGATFAQEVKAYLEEPGKLMLHMI